MKIETRVQGLCCYMPCLTTSCMIQEMCMSTSVDTGSSYTVCKAVRCLYA